MTTVSVIIPAFNQAAYLLAAVASAQAQTLPPAQIIIIDDGSTDATPEILADLCADDADGDGRRINSGQGGVLPPGRPAPTDIASTQVDARRHARQGQFQSLRVIRQENQGLARARNRGLQMAQGELIAFLDADDRWQPEYLAAMTALLAEHPTAVAAYAAWQYMDADGALLPQIIIPYEAALLTLDSDITWRNALVPSGVVVRRAALTRSGDFDPAFSGCADWDLWLRLLAQGPFAGAAAVLVHYRTHGDNMSDNVERMEDERLRVYHKFLQRPTAEPVNPAAWPSPGPQWAGYTYFLSALAYLRQGDSARGAARIEVAAALWPGLLDQDEFYYELACCRQPRGFSGTAQGLDLAESGARIQRLLDADLPALDAQQARQAWGRAGLALAQLGAVTGDRPAQRRFAWQALRFGAPVVRRLAGRRLLRSFVPDAWRRKRARP